MGARVPPKSTSKTKRIPQCLAQTTGPCADAIRSIDWEYHVLGPIESWPLVLQSTLATILRSRQPIFVFWGPHHVSFYNDAYMPALGLHAQTRGIGCLAKDFWHEVWDQISPQIEATMLRGEATWHDDQCLVFSRDGQLQATYWTYGYAPIYLNASAVGGALVTCNETTKRVLSERRLSIVQQLSANLMRCRLPKDVIAILISTVEEHSQDIVQVVFERLGEADYLPTFAASRRRAPYEALHPDNPHLRETRILGALTNAYLGALRFEAPAQSVIDAGYLNFLNQITDRVSVAIENMRTRMQGDIFFNLPHRLLCIASTSGHLTRVSPAFAEALGFDSEYLLSVPFTDFVHPDDLERTFDAIAVLQKQQTVVNFTNRYRCHDGSYRWFSWVSQPRGELVYCVVHDITDLKHAETKLLHALEARDAFLSIASHELKTPITSLKLYSQLVERQYQKQGLPYFTEDRIERVIRMLLSQSDRLGRLVEDMLDISRIAAGRLAMQIEKTSLTTVVADVVARFDLQIKAAASIVHTALQPDVIGYFDAFRVEQVLSNLLTNALRYAPGESVTISLTQEGDDAVLRVADTGPGIPPAHRNRIFQRFERFVSSSEVSGLGLGLYISRQIIAAHHGIIRLDTGTSKGACFEVRLPLTQRVQRELGVG